MGNYFNAPVRRGISSCTSSCGHNASSGMGPTKGTGMNETLVEIFKLVGVMVFLGAWTVLMMVTA